MKTKSLPLALLVATLLTSTSFTSLAADDTTADTPTAIAATATTASANATTTENAVADQANKEDNTTKTTTVATDNDGNTTTTTTTTTSTTVKTKELTSADKEKAELVTELNKKAAAYEAEQAAKGFKDVKNHWAAVQINTFLEEGILSGNGQGLFHPDEALKTADAASLYNKLITANQAKAAAKAKTEVKKSKKTATTTVKEITGDELLAPFAKADTLTREEFAQTAAQYLAYKDDLAKAAIKSKTKANEYAPQVVVAPADVSFPDENKIDSDYKEAIVTLASRGMIASVGDSNFFRPTDDITRAEAVAILFRIDKNLPISATTTKTTKEDANKESTTAKTSTATKTSESSTPTRTVTAKPTAALEDQSELENKVFKKLNSLYKTPGNFQNYGVMYWQNNVLHVAFKSDEDLAKFEDILAKDEKSTSDDKLVLAKRIHLESTEYSQAEYDRIEANFRTFYAQKQPAGTILAVYPSVAHNQLVVRIDKGFDYMNDSIRSAFGNKVHVFLVTNNTNTDTTTNTTTR